MKVVPTWIKFEKRCLRFKLLSSWYRTYRAPWSTYLRTYSVEQSPSWEANRFSASQEIPTFYGTRRFITSFTSVRHLSMNQLDPVHAPKSNFWRSILILSSHLCPGLPNGLFPSCFRTSDLPHTCYMPTPSHSSRVMFYTIVLLNNCCALHTPCFFTRVLILDPTRFGVC